MDAATKLREISKEAASGEKSQAATILTLLGVLAALGRYAWVNLGALLFAEWNLQSLQILAMVAIVGVVVHFLILDRATSYLLRRIYPARFELTHTASWALRAHHLGRLGFGSFRVLATIDGIAMMIGIVSLWIIGGVAGEGRFIFSSAAVIGTVVVTFVFIGLFLLPARIVAAFIAAVIAGNAFVQQRLKPREADQLPELMQLKRVAGTVMPQNWKAIRQTRSSMSRLMRVAGYAVAIPLITGMLASVISFGAMVQVGLSFDWAVAIAMGAMAITLPLALAIMRLSLNLLFNQTRGQFLLTADLLESKRWSESRAWNFAQSLDLMRRDEMFYPGTPTDLSARLLPDE